jgi:hypothetical protein
MRMTVNQTRQHDSAVSVNFLIRVCFFVFRDRFDLMVGD